MPRGVQRPRLDANHKAVEAHLVAHGMSFLSLAAVGRGCPDALVGYLGVNVLLEIKDGAKSPSRRALTEDEGKFRDKWRGQCALVTSPDEALAAVKRVIAGRVNGVLAGGKP